jgi:sulfoxide reductase catalytic subunit YedY
MMKYPIDPSEITLEELYVSRRRFIKNALTVSAAALLTGACGPGQESLPTTHTLTPDTNPPTASALRDDMGNLLTDYNSIISYTNYYEFSTDKQGPTRLAQDFQTTPWSVAVGGLVNNPRIFTTEEINSLFSSEEHIYRMRCVEGWSMVIPWIGFPLSRLLDVVEPNSQAKYVRFETLFDPEQMPNQRSPIFPWPYIEGLRMDEAMHDLTLLATGIYGKGLTPQNGAPIRLVVPWKYGFKSIKSIVKIDLVEEMPVSLWMASSPSEYGFYANVNPNVNHPRWSQATERRIGQDGRIDTLLFNGYEDEVAGLYEGMDLAVDF